MKTTFLILAAVVILGLIIWGFSNWGKPDKSIASYNATDPNAPHLEIPQKSFDFGKISVTQAVNHDFTLKNTGLSPLTISNIMTSCHCTTARLKVSGQADSPEFNMNHNDWSEDLPSGATATLSVKYDPNVMPVNGPVSRVITFTSNDPKNKEIQLEILAEVK